MGPRAMPLSFSDERLSPLQNSRAIDLLLSNAHCHPSPPQTDHLAADQARDKIRLTLLPAYCMMQARYCRNRRRQQDPRPKSLSKTGRETVWASSDLLSVSATRQHMHSAVGGGAFCGRAVLPCLSAPVCPRTFLWLRNLVYTFIRSLRTR